jgi:Tat protein secretion system quality control protein TatD with DNase activity
MIDCISVRKMFSSSYDLILHLANIHIMLRYFEKQLQIAKETKLPVFFHDRNTSLDFLGT